MNRKKTAILLLSAVLGTPLPALAMGGYGGGMAPTMHTSMRRDEYSEALQLIRHEHFADAIPHLDRALADRPHNADILNYLGFTHRMVGDYPLSLSFYQRALSEDPDHKGAHEYLGELYLDMHDPVSAQAQLDALATLCPDGCDERDTLTKSIAAYAAANPAPATTGQPPARGSP
ncbi:MAG TPA: tetratricopeptide repeat protein [Rhizomicrobium sp.]|jgi:tetratricopeptide (TPR) repeat protein